MSLQHKGINMTPQQLPSGKTKDLTGCERLAKKLGSILRENNSNELLQRQLAGLDRRKRRRAAVPSVFKFQKQYEQNRKKKLQQLSKAQRELRQFQSHPVPNFNHLHKRWEQRNKLRQMRSLVRVTKAETPVTLLKSLEANKKRDRFEQPSRCKLIAPSSHSWRKPPFIPRIESSFIKVQPFHLLSVERGKRRKEYDEQRKEEQQLVWQHKAALWAKHCREEFKQLRSQTNFKARSNPWKRTRALH